MGLLKLCIDRQNKKLVSFNGSVVDLPPLYQTNTQDFQIQIVDPVDDLIIPYTVFDASAAQLRMVIAAAATGEIGDASILAATYEAGWAWDAGSQAFLGSLNINTDEIAGFIDQDATKNAILEINLISGGTPETIFGQRSAQANVTLQANADEGGSPAPTSLTTAQVIGTKTLQDGVGGVSIVANRVTISGLGLGGAPSNVLLFINTPAGSGAIAASFELGSATADHFSFIVSGVPDNNNYSVTYVLTF